MSQESFLGRQPSEYYIETIEPSVVVSIKYDDLEELYNKSKKMEHLGRLVVTYMMVIRDRWQMQMVKMTPRETFLNFVMKNPELMQRVPQKYLACYLNIKPETFSRFKHLLRNHSKNSCSVMRKLSAIESMSKLVVNQFSWHSTLKLHCLFKSDYCLQMHYQHGIFNSCLTALIVSP